MSKEVMQQALEALEWCYDVTEWPASGDTPQDKAIKALRTALAQPEPAECDGGQCGIGGYCKQCPKTQPEQEPVGINEVILDSIRDSSEVVAPPQREWVGLTDDDFAIWKEPAIGILRWAEATLKEKNT